MQIGRTKIRRPTWLVMSYSVPCQIYDQIFLIHMFSLSLSLSLSLMSKPTHSNSNLCRFFPPQKNDRTRPGHISFNLLPWMRIFFILTRLVISYMCHISRLNLYKHTPFVIHFFRIQLISLSFFSYTTYFILICNK